MLNEKPCDVRGSTARLRSRQRPKAQHVGQRHLDVERSDEHAGANMVGDEYSMSHQHAGAIQCLLYREGIEGERGSSKRTTAQMNAARPDGPVVSPS